MCNGLGHISDCCAIVNNRVKTFLDKFYAKLLITIT